MKALFVSGIILFSLFLLLNTPAFGQAESVLSVAQLEDIKSETEETVKLARFQLHRAYDKEVVASRRKRINVSSRVLKNAMINDAVAGDNLKKILETRRVNSTYVANCKKISSELRLALKYFASGKLNMARDSIIAVEELAKRQPAPLGIEAVLKNFESTAQLEDLKSETLEIVKLARSQLHHSFDKDVVGSRRKRLNIASRIFKNAMFNDAVVGDLLKKLFETGMVNSTHILNCKEISLKISIIITYFSYGKLNMARDSIIAVDELAKRQPAPVRIKEVLKKIDRVVTEESRFFAISSKTETEVNRIKSAQAHVAVSKEKKKVPTKKKELKKVPAKKKELKCVQWSRRHCKEWREIKMCIEILSPVIPNKNEECIIVDHRCVSWGKKYCAKWE